MELLNNIPFNAGIDEVLKKIHIETENKEIIDSIEEILIKVNSAAKPKVLYTVSYVSDRNSNSVLIDNVRFTSRVLRKNLNDAERVFPYIATCGKELEEIEFPYGDIIISYCLDAIKGMALKNALDYLQNHISGRYMTGRLSKMNPGSLKDWPITQQKELFSLFDDTETTIGVKLSESFLMTPVKSVSGIYFPTEKTFESCILCSREVCSGRRKPYNPKEARKYNL